MVSKYMLNEHLCPTYIRPVLLLPLKEVITTADRSSHSIFIWGELGSESAQPELGAQDPHVPGALWHMRVPASILYP